MSGVRYPCKLCGRPLRWLPIQRTFAHLTLKEDRDHVALLLRSRAPSSAVQDRIEDEKKLEHLGHIHDGSVEACPYCQEFADDLLLKSMGLRTVKKDAI
jgi:hypothetical protein